MQSKPFEPAEVAALAYLGAPQIIFFATFIRAEIAIPACGLIAFNVYQVCRRTSWRKARILMSSGSIVSLLVASAWLCWVHGGGSLHQNSDWVKHYAVLNFLVQNPWPPKTLGDAGMVVLRYYVGWYLIPALVLKLGWVASQQAALITWSLIGVWIFLSLLRSLIFIKPSEASIGIVLISVVAFAMFGGADFLGAILVKPNMQDGHPLEWWSGWIQYSGNTASISWVPQHAISAWLGSALVMRNRDGGYNLPFIAFTISAVLLWSPFAALGLLPFVCRVACGRRGRQPLFEWQSVACCLLLGLPTFLYLISGSSSIPHGFIYANPCTFGLPCFTLSSYLIFVLIEFSFPAAILILRRVEEDDFLKIAIVSLLLIPLYKVGLLNDFAMRTSLPAITVLAILSIKVLINGPLRYSLACLSLFLIATPEVYDELSIPVLSRVNASEISTFADSFTSEPEVLAQYFAAYPLLLLR